MQTYHITVETLDNGYLVTTSKYSTDGNDPVFGNGHTVRRYCLEPAEIDDVVSDFLVGNL